MGIPCEMYLIYICSIVIFGAAVYDPIVGTVRTYYGNIYQVSPL